MNESEKNVADILLARIADADAMSVSSTIARYRDFIEAVNRRKRVLVTGWSEIKELSEWEEPEQEATEDEPTEADGGAEYWKVLANEAINQICNGHFTRRRSAEAYMRIHECEGLSLVKVVLYK